MLTDELNERLSQRPVELLFKGIYGRTSGNVKAFEHGARMGLYMLKTSVIKSECYYCILQNPEGRKGFFHMTKFSFGSWVICLPCFWIRENDREGIVYSRHE